MTAISFGSFAASILPLMKHASQEVRDDLTLIWHHYRRGQVLYNDLITNPHRSDEALACLTRCLEFHGRVWEGIRQLEANPVEEDVTLMALKVKRILSEMHRDALEMSVQAALAEELIWKIGVPC